MKISVFREYKINISFSTESVKTKIPQFRAKLDIGPEIMASRQVFRKMFLVLNRRVKSVEMSSRLIFQKIAAVKRKKVKEVPHQPRTVIV